jgi:hypothetical protein
MPWRPVILDYAFASVKRDMTNPRIATYSDYTGPNWGYPNVEAHDGGELWSASLWDLHNNSAIGNTTADWLVYGGLHRITSSATFLAYREGIIAEDQANYGGTHLNKIKNTFALRGIGDPTLPLISGPSRLSVGQQGTWTVSTDWGTGSYSYAWYFRSSDTGGQWSGPVSASSSYSTRMYDYDGYLDVRADVTSGALHSSATKHVTCADCSGGPLGPQVAQDSTLSDTFSANTTGGVTIEQNYPNPFNPTTQIRFTLLKPLHVRLMVYDMLGREVARLADQQMSEGFHSVTWNAGGMASGVYIYRLSAGNFVQVKRMILMK